MQNSGIPQYLGLARFGILQKLLQSFVEILKLFSTQFSVVHGGWGGWGRFSGIAQCERHLDTSGNPIQFFFNHTTLLLLEQIVFVKRWTGVLHIQPRFRIT